MNDIKRILHINFKDGTGRQIDPVQNIDDLGKDWAESFNDLNMEEKANITSLILQVGHQKFTISRSFKEKGEKKHLDGYFYHIMDGYDAIMGSKNIPFAAERIGFCYNTLGDAVAIHVNYLTGNITNYDENVQMLRQNVEMFYEIPRGHKMKYRKIYTPFREAISALKTRNQNHLVVDSEENIPPDHDHKEVPVLVLPQIPGLPLKGAIPRVLFNSKDVSRYNVQK